MTQNERILRHLHDFGSITALEAMNVWSRKQDIFSKRLWGTVALLVILPDR